jgi:hypothetical protein
MGVDIFDTIDIEIPNESNDKIDIFDKLPTDESFLKSATRTALQVPLGIAEVTPPGILSNIINFIGQGESLDPEEIDQIKKISDRLGIPFDEEKYRESVKDANQTFPTVDNLSRMTEEATGIPLEPKTKLQKLTRFASSAGKMTPGSLGQKATASVAAPLTKEILEATGVPTPISELLAFPIGIGVGKKGPKIDIIKKTKPSGLTERGFENVKKKTEVSQNKLNQIGEKIEKDFKSISDKIITESPIGKTYEKLINDPQFKQDSSKLIEYAQEIANDIEKKINSKEIKKTLVNQKEKKTKGYSPSEYDKSYNNSLNQELLNIKKGKISAGELVEQYRKNNSSLTEYFEPGSSKASNRAKMDVILDHNKAIATIIEKEFPESNLAKTFKEGNDRWSKIMDSETIDHFVNDIFKDKIDYKNVDSFFNDKNYKRIFKRALGEKGYQDFTQLVKDLGDTKKPYNMLKVAEKNGYKDLAQTAMSYVIHPKLGIAKSSINSAKSGFRLAMNSILDKPKLTITWKNGIDSLKKGDFNEANKQFKNLEFEIEKFTNQKKY